MNHESGIKNHDSFLLHNSYFIILFLRLLLRHHKLSADLNSLSQFDIVNPTMSETEIRINRGRPDNALEYAPDGSLYLGSAIRHIRQQKGLSLDELSKSVGYKQSAALSNIENNRASISGEKLIEIARALDVYDDELRSVPLHPRLAKTAVRILRERLPESGIILSNEEEQLIARLTDILSDPDISQEARSVFVSMIDVGVRALQMNKRYKTTFSSGDVQINSELRDDTINAAEPPFY